MAGLEIDELIKSGAQEITNRHRRVAFRSLPELMQIRALEQNGHEIESVPTVFREQESCQDSE